MIRRLMVCAIVALVLAPGPGLAIGQDLPSDRADLAALVLRSSDPPLTDFVHLGAFDESLEVEATSVAAYHGFVNTPEQVRLALQEAGWQRKHVSRLGLVNSQNETQMVQIVQSYVTEFASTGGAASAFALLEDETGAAGAVDREPSRRFGDETDLTLDEGIDPDGRPFQSLDLTFRVDTRIGGVTLTVYPTAAGSDPEQAQVEALGALLEERLQAPPAPDVGFSLARLNPGGAVTYDDAYYRRGDWDIALEGELGAAAELRRQAYGDAETVYQLFQGVSVGEQASLLYSLTVYRFVDGDAANAWLDDAAQFIGLNPYYDELRESPINAPEADRSRAFTFQPPGGGVALIGLGVTGAVVHRVQLVPALASLPDATAVIEELLAYQIGCWMSGECIAIPVPPSLKAMTEIPAATPAGADPAAATPAP